jgi:pyruvate/oxaloacetate carboxyltransferase
MSEKRDGLHTILVKKGVKKGIDYVNISVDGVAVGESNSDKWDMSRALTGTTAEEGLGIFQEEKSCIEFKYGEQVLKYEATRQLTKRMATVAYADELKNRILVVRAWVQDRDFDSEVAFSV